MLLQRKTYGFGEVKDENQLFGLTKEEPAVAVCYPRKTLINSLMPTTSM